LELLAAKPQKMQLHEVKYDYVLSIMYERHVQARILYNINWLSTRKLSEVELQKNRSNAIKIIIEYKQFLQNNFRLILYP